MFNSEGNNPYHMPFLPGHNKLQADKAIATPGEAETTKELTNTKETHRDVLNSQDLCNYLNEKHAKSTRREYDFIDGFPCFSN